MTRQFASCLASCFGCKNSKWGLALCGRARSSHRRPMQKHQCQSLTRSNDATNQIKETKQQNKKTAVPMLMHPLSHAHHHDASVQCTISPWNFCLDLSFPPNITLHAPHRRRLFPHGLLIIMRAHLSLLLLALVAAFLGLAAVTSAADPKDCEGKEACEITGIQCMVGFGGGSRTF